MDVKEINERVSNCVNTINNTFILSSRNIGKTARIIRFKTIISNIDTYVKNDKLDLAESLIITLEKEVKTYTAPLNGSPAKIHITRK